MDELDKKLLTAIQADLPVDERPFDRLAERLGTSAEDVLERVSRFVREGHVRRIGPVFDSRMLGYVSTLVAAKIPADRLEEVAARVSALAGVTHNYERRHAYNLWFTLTSPSGEAEAGTLSRLRRETGIPHFFSLPALRVYKIRVHFDLSGDEAEAADAGAEGESPAPGTRGGAPVVLSEDDKSLVRFLQDGLPAEPRPLDDAARRLGWPPGRVVEQVRRWLEAGVIRRYGAVVRHQRLGYHANGMSVFSIDDDRADDVGRRLALRPEVSHCYLRPPLPDFPFNLFAMTHGRTEDEVRSAARGMAQEADAVRYDVLFSVREFKKVSMRYFMEEDASRG